MVDKAFWFLETVISIEPTWASFMGFSALPSHLSRNQPLNLAQGSALWTPIMLNYSLFPFSWSGKQDNFVLKICSKTFIYAWDLPCFIKDPDFWKSEVKMRQPMTPDAIVKSLPWFTDQRKGWLTKFKKNKIKLEISGETKQ